MNRTHQKLDLIGTIFGIVGGLMCLLAVVLRIVLGAGSPREVSVSPRSLMWLGTALLAFACFLKLTARDR